MRLADETTKTAVYELYIIKNGLNAAARSVSTDNTGQVAGTMSDILLDKTIALERENTLRVALGLEPLARLDKRPVCPIHDVVHDTECDGEQGEAVWVHPKEKLVKAPGFGRTRKERKSIEVTPDVYRLLLKFKATGDWDWSKSLTEMFYLATEGAGYDDEKFPEAGIQ